MKDVVKVRFVKDCEAAGREYTYYTPVPVKVGDLVDVETIHGVVQAQVARINVPLEEIARFGDRARSIIGKTACRCETCGLLHPCPTGAYICEADLLKIPINGEVPTEHYLWCKGCHYHETDNPGAVPTLAPTAEDGQTALDLPGRAETPWDRA